MYDGRFLDRAAPWMGGFSLRSDNADQRFLDFLTLQGCTLVYQDVRELTIEVPDEGTVTIGVHVDSVWVTPSGHTVYCDLLDEEDFTPEIYWDTDDDEVGAALKLKFKQSH